MALQFTKEEVEHAIDDLLIWSDRRDIAQISGLGESLVKRQLNPEDVVPSSIFVALQIICALDQKDPERGEKVWQKINEMRELSKPHQKSETSLDVAVSNFNTEFSEYISAKLAGKPFLEQIQEFLDIERELPKLKQALLDEYNRLKETPKAISVKLGSGK